MTRPTAHPVRFMRHVSPEPNTGCWLWTGCVYEGRGGYGAYGWTGSKPMRANRAAWLIFVGPIAAGLHVCHRCDQPSCVNPDHLFLGTRSDNMRDMVAKGRIGKRYCSLSAQQVADVRVLRGLGFTFQTIADGLGTNRETARKVAHGANYAIRDEDNANDYGDEP